MGLDSVELVMTVEDHFRIEIPDKEASQISTVGELHEFVIGALARAGRTDVGHQQAYEQLREIICSQFGVEPQLVRPEARIVKDLAID